MKAFSLKKVEILIESFNVPKFLCTFFSVFGSFLESKEAIYYALNRLNKHRRIDYLILLEPNVVDMESLEKIASYGCKIYCFFKVEKINKREFLKYEEIAKHALVFIHKELYNP